MYTVTKGGVRKRLESWRLVLPIHDNDGRLFPADLVERVVEQILFTFPGISTVASKGYWRGKERIFHDSSITLIADVFPDGGDAAESFFLSLKRDLTQRLNQEKIYVTRDTAVEELVTFREFFTEVGVEAIDNDEGQLHETALALTKDPSILLRRLGYRTTAVHRNKDSGTIVWERVLADVPLRSVFVDDFPQDVLIVGADQINEIARWLGVKPLAIIGTHEASRYIESMVVPRPLLRADATRVPDSAGREYPYRSPTGTKLSSAQFVEEFGAQILVHVAVLRDEGFQPFEIHLSIGHDGSLQRTSSPQGNILLIAPAVGLSEAVIGELSRCTQLGLQLLEDGKLDPVALLQAKAKYQYNLKRAEVRAGKNSAAQ